MKPYFFAISLILLLISCEKDKLLYSSEKMISGTAYINDTELNERFLVSAADVKLQQDSSDYDYLFKTSTDSVGYFEFPYVPDERYQKTLYVKAETRRGGVVYGINQRVAPGASGITLDLAPTYENALKVTVQNDQGEPWHNIQTYLYQNATLAQFVVDQQTVGTSGFIANQVTNRNGIVIFTNLRVNTSYQVVIFLNNLDGGNTRKKVAQKLITISSSTLTSTPIEITL